MMNRTNRTNSTNRTNRANRMIGKKLTSRELLVLALTASGFSDREIAEKLSVSVRTVNIHVEHFRAKLGAKSREQAAVKALKNGLLSFDDIESLGNA